MKEYAKTTKGKARSDNYRKDNDPSIKLMKRIWCISNPDKTRSYNQKRRALKHNAFVSSVNPTAIFERDNWTCKLCGRPVDRTVDHRHWDYPTIDHVVPLNKGGTHEPSNVQCTHFGCNNRKSDKYPVTDPEAISAIIKFNRVSLQVSGGIW